MEINKEILIGLGGKLWEKENISRVYINDQVLAKLDFKIVDKPSYANEYRGLGKSKLFFDCVKNCFIADTGSIRVLMKNNGFKCA